MEPQRTPTCRRQQREKSQDESRGGKAGRSTERRQVRPVLQGGDQWEGPERMRMSLKIIASTISARCYGWKIHCADLRCELKHSQARLSGAWNILINHLSGKPKPRKNLKWFPRVLLCYFSRYWLTGVTAPWGSKSA